MTELVADATDPSENRPIEGPWGPRDWSKSRVPERQCTAHTRNGERCKNAAIRGGTVCGYHGGGAPAVKRKARQRIDSTAHVFPPAMNARQQKNGRPASAVDKSNRLTWRCSCQRRG